MLVSCVLLLGLRSVLGLVKAHLDLRMGRVEVGSIVFKAVEQFLVRLFASEVCDVLQVSLLISRVVEAVRLNSTARSLHRRSALLNLSRLAQPVEFDGTLLFAVGRVSLHFI